MLARTKPVTVWMNSPRQDRGQQTAERILTATEQLMAKRPFREISVAQIVRKAKASQSSFYARFSDKDALLGFIYERHNASQNEMIDELLALDRWRNVPLAKTIRETFPVIVESYRKSQGLVRAFLDLASSDERFRRTWAETGDYVVVRVKEIVLARPFEVEHPDPSNGIDYMLDFVFANIAYDILTHEIDAPKMDAKVEQLIQMMLRFMGIKDVVKQARGSMKGK